MEIPPEVVVAKEALAEPLLRSGLMHGSFCVDQMAWEPS